MNPARALSQWALPASMFLGSFSWSFVYVSLPFYIHDMSPYDAAATLRWTGWILGISPLITVVTAPISGRLVHGRDRVGLLRRSARRRRRSHDITDGCDDETSPCQETIVSLLLRVIARQRLA